MENKENPKTKQEIEQEERELNKRLEELGLLKKSISITVKFGNLNLTNGNIEVILSDYRDDVVNALRSIEGRYVRDDINYIRCNYVDNLIIKLNQLPNVIIEYHDIGKNLVSNWLNAPNLTIDYELGIVNIYRHPNLSQGIYTYEIPSWKSKSQIHYTVSVTDIELIEGFLIKRYPQYTTFYTDRFKEFLANKKKLEGSLEEIHSLVDAPEEDITLPNNNLKLSPDQRVALKFHKHINSRSIIAYDMGKGKTAIPSVLAYKENYRILFVCKANLKINIAREIKKFTGQEAIILDGIEPSSLAIDLLMNPKNKYFIINYEVIGRGIKEVVNGKVEVAVMKWPVVLNTVGNFDLAAFDEAHYMKNVDAARSKGGRAIKSKEVMMLTGTPIVNRPGELWPLLNIIDPVRFDNFATFKGEYSYSDGTPRNLDVLHKLMKNYMIVRKNPPGDIRSLTVYSELNEKAKEHYDKVLNGIYISLRKPDYQRNVTSILAELMRLKQITSSAKVDDTVDLVETALDETEDHQWNKVLVFSQFKEVHNTIKMKLGSKCQIINGDVGMDERYELIDKFQNKSSNLKVIVSNIEEGITLTEAGTVIFNDHTWTPKTILQFRGRAFGRTNDPHGGNSYDVICPNTIDEQIQGIISDKLKIIDGVVEGKVFESGSIINDLLDEMRR